MRPDETLWCVVSVAAVLYHVGDAIITLSCALWRALKGA